MADTGDGRRAARESGSGSAQGAYGQWSKAETAFQVIKGVFGSVVSSRGAGRWRGGCPSTYLFTAATEPRYTRCCFSMVVLT